MRPFDSGAIRAFVGELEETLPQIATALEASRQQHDRQALAEAHRLLHCLKGAAGMVGLPALAYLINLGEDLVERSLAVPDADPAAGRLESVRACLPRFQAYLAAGASGATADMATAAAALVHELAVTADTLDGDTLETLIDIDRRELGIDGPAHPSPVAAGPDLFVRPAVDDADELPADADVPFALTLDDDLAGLPAFDGELAAVPDDSFDTLLTALPPLTPDESPLATETDLTALLDEFEADWPALAPEPSFEPPVAPAAAPAVAARVQAPTHPELPDLVPLEAVPPDLAAVFAPEAAEHLQTIASITTSLSPDVTDRDSLQELRRAVHTLKGAAGVVGYKAAARLAHGMENLLDRLYEETAVLTPAVVRLLAATSDALDESINGASDPTALRATISRLLADYDGPGTVATAPAAAAPPAGAPAAALESEAPDHRAERWSGSDRRVNDQVLRVPVARLDDMVRSVSELVLNRSTFEQHYAALIAQVEELKFSAARIRKVAQRLEADYEVKALAGNTVSVRHDGFDALEFDRYTDFHLLTRELTETASDVATISARIGDSIDDVDGDLTRLGRLTREIQDRTMEFRMLPLHTLATRLERTVRVTAETCGKSVDFALEGADVTVDKSLLDHLADPLLHLLRNAVDHGIEPPEERRAAGKPERGRIVVRAFHDGTDVVVEVEDDGRGLDRDRIRRTAIERGLVGSADAAALAPEALFEFIFAPGFSTAARVSEISGRGVGMDVVKSAVVRAGGRIQIDSRPGAGVTMSVRAPMTLAITRVLLVRAGGQTFGLPLGAVVQIVRPHPTAVTDVGGNRVLTLDGRAHVLRDLADVLGLARSPDAPASQPVLIANLAGQRVALAVDAILHSRDAVVKSLGSHLRRVPGLWGATLLGDGTVVLILNAADLGGAAAETRVRVVSRPAAATGPQTGTVLVVDDSLSMRHVLSTTLTRAGWDVRQARDGLDALAVMHRSTHPPDAILLDIEMPRMDGYELLASVRATPALAAVPVVMLTSRGSDKHRDKASALGATGYLVKPFRDDLLIETITRVVQAARGARRAS